MGWRRTSYRPRSSPINLHRCSAPLGSAHSEILQRHYDLAASVQAVLEENYFALLNHVQKNTRQKTICLAGGVALNCVANGMIFDRTDFRDVYIQPAAHDAGTSIGAALYVQHQILRQPRSFVMQHVYYGPEYSNAEIQRDLELAGAGLARTRARRSRRGARPRISPMA